MKPTKLECLKKLCTPCIFLNLCLPSGPAYSQPPSVQRSEAQNLLIEKNCNVVTTGAASWFKHLLGSRKDQKVAMRCIQNEEGIQDWKVTDAYYLKQLQDDGAFRRSRNWSQKSQSTQDDTLYRGELFERSYKQPNPSLKNKATLHGYRTITPDSPFN